MNIHRHPFIAAILNISPKICLRKMAVAQLQGMHKYGVTGTIKHLLVIIRNLTAMM